MRNNSTTAVDYERIALAARAPSHCRTDLNAEETYALPARQLLIASGNSSKNWKWTPQPDSSCTEVAELLKVRNLRIEGLIESKKLPPGTSYAVYLIFKLSEYSSGLQKAKAFVRFVKDKSVGIEDDASCSTTIYLLGNEGNSIIQTREDGWTEVKLGEFLNSPAQRQGGDGGGGVKVVLTRRRYFRKMSGLILKGIEVRPNNSKPDR